MSPNKQRILVSTIISTAMALVFTQAIGAESENTKANPQETSERVLPKGVSRSFGIAPSVPSGLLSEELQQAVNTAFGESLGAETWGPEQNNALRAIAESEDVRLAWIITDLMRIAGSSEFLLTLSAVVNDLFGIEVDRENPWGDTVDHLIAWDIPAPPNYLKFKRNIYTLIVPEWQKLFTEGEIDWRHVSWGGVRIDDRPFGETDTPCNCIPAADNPKVSSADEADWLADDAVVFGIEINGESRAYPRRIMEVREMVNDTLGGRDLAIPYCTLCGAAQAYFADNLPGDVERPVMRTSGLLIRSNKVMYDVNTFSVFDTFKGHAVTGPLAEKGIALKQAGVVTTKWGEWKAAHPETTVLVEELALGRDFDFRNNRDAKGPIFPVGDVDPRLPVHEDILGIITETGTPVAFHIGTALTALNSGEEITFEDVRLVLDGGGVRAVDTQGMDLGSHQAFWFAWSQFHPETKLWPF